MADVARDASGDVTTFCLAVPHTPWVPARAESVRRLEPVLDERHRLFTERAPNWEWSRTMWRWMADQEDTYAVQLQDDVLPHPSFWRIVEAMVAGNPEARVIGLHAGHPAGPALAASGARWYRTRAWVVGVGYIVRGDVMHELAEWREANDALARTLNEDDFIARFCGSHGIDVWHPMPSPIDHDVTVPSTYGNDAHANRRPTVSADAYDTDAMCRAEFWRVDSTAPLLVSPYAMVCAHCGGDGVVARTELPVCRLCIVRMVAQVMGLQTEARDG